MRARVCVGLLTFAPAAEAVRPLVLCASRNKRRGMSRVSTWAHKQPHVHACARARACVCVCVCVWCNCSCAQPSRVQTWLASSLRWLLYQLLPVALASVVAHAESHEHAYWHPHAHIHTSTRTNTTTWSHLLTYSFWLEKGDEACRDKYAVACWALEVPHSFHRTIIEALLADRQAGMRLATG